MAAAVSCRNTKKGRAVPVIFSAPAVNSAYFELSKDFFVAAMPAVIMGSIVVAASSGKKSAAQTILAVPLSFAKTCADAL